MKEGPYEIGEIDFNDIKVKVYHDPHSTPDMVNCCWRARNPDSFYQGIVYRNNETGELTYPEGVVIPEQTDRDREMIPNFFITGKDELSPELLESIDNYLNREHKRRNNITDE